MRIINNEGADNASIFNEVIEMHSPSEVGKIFHLSRNHIMIIVRELGLKPQKCGQTYVLTDDDIAKIRYRLLARYNLQYLLDDNNDDDNEEKQ